MQDVSAIVKTQRDYFSSRRTIEIPFRADALKRLKSSIINHEQEILDALKSDLNKSPFEAYATEVGIILDEIGFAVKNLKSWSKPKHVHTPIVHFPSRSRIFSEPYGVVLIMSPWNYPFQLTLAPLIGAIAGGNCAVVKPSAYSPATSSIIAKLLEESFAQGHVAVIEGGRQENQALLEQKFDYLFFTGSAAVGKNVMEAASKHLTPVSLELGGKSPCIVCADADIDLAARRIIWGKTLNAGQTCVAPDYVLVQRAVKPQLIERMKHYITEFFGDHPCKNEEFPKIINEKHFIRVSGYLSCGTVAAGGETDAQALKISPTILTDVSWDQPVMQEEIFGPVLPVIAFDDTGEAINLIIGRPKPLALYLFTKSKRTQAEITDRVSFGGGCINDTIVHLATPYMPFGGVGESGMGGYHGKYSFDTFTHKKSILQKSNILDIKLRYPPYRGKFALLKKLMG